MIQGEPYWGSPTSVGPIRLFPTAAEVGNGYLSGQLVVRFNHGSPVLPPGNRPYESSPNHYIEMYAGEEVAALLSVALGVRLRDGGLIRRFQHGKDPAGEPELHNHRAPTSIPVPDRRIQFPGLRGKEVKLAHGVKWLLLYPKLQPAEAIALAKAARCYADALWVGDNDPQQAWLHLVTALETLAVHMQTDALNPMEVLQDAYPKLVELITGREVSDILPAVANVLVETAKATRRFLDFTCHYAPPPPSERPDNEGVRLDWDSLRRALAFVYEHRSNYLHAGRPMPPGMIGVDLELGDDGRPPECIERDTEIMAGRSAWKAKQVPMHLWVLAYITRGALLNWWQERVELSGM
ncbi:hypothetical protein [Streptomyces sp. HUAS TT20]|uniref:hypothetical protein n=1 Tax=Streptomyces sp. HUAS TT20 TaxID=3447509 RepID=UPI0021DB141A|nr:hypothetical protein [Streptomyces sp. HUAS 15-9]UXY29936.1 hypothetical protein N8I87_27550 [Streptomyces sp. HUAS 15-9]